MLRVPFFLEPEYPTAAEFEETNRVRLLRKWGGKRGWDEQKRRHALKERGREVGIEHFNLDRVASNTVRQPLSHAASPLRRAASCPLCCRDRQNAGGADTRSGVGGTCGSVSHQLASHRLVQWVTKTLGVNAAERMYADLNARHFVEGARRLLRVAGCPPPSSSHCGAEVERSPARLFS